MRQNVVSAMSNGSVVRALVSKDKTYKSEGGRGEDQNRHPKETDERGPKKKKAGLLFCIAGGGTAASSWPILGEKRQRDAVVCVVCVG